MPLNKETKPNHIFPKCISAMWNAINLVQDLNSYRRVHYTTGTSYLSICYINM